MTWLGLSTGGAHAPDKLDPPPTPAELEWWKHARAPIQREVILKSTLLPQVPLFIGLAYMRGWTFVASWGGLRMIGGFAVICAVSALANWRIIAGARCRHELIGKRLREAITAPEQTGN